MSKKQALWVMVICLLVAAGLRLPELVGAPPGLHYDEAANAILSGDIGLRGARPIFISSYTGKEVLFFYAAGGLMALIGESVFALRLTAALMGLLTVAVTYALGREVFKQRAVGVLAAVILATSFWHLLFSRLGFRAISQPLLQALTVWFLVKGVLGVRCQVSGGEGVSGSKFQVSGFEVLGRGSSIQNPKSKIQNSIYFLLAGVCLGLAAYTYLAVRLFPVLLVVGGVVLWREWRVLWRPLVGMVMVAGVVLAPLLGYFGRRPEAFWVRIEQVGVDGLPLGESVWRSLQMFFVDGDPYWRFNLPGMPLFGPFVALLGLLGMVVMMMGWKRWVRPEQRFGMVLILAAPLVMLLPTALATNEIVPSNLRAIGMLPFVMFLPAYGIFWYWERAKTGERPWALSIIALVLLFGSGGVTGNRYFGQWAERADVFYENDSDLAAVAEYLNEREFDRPVYVSALQYPHPTLAFLADEYDGLKLLLESNALAIPADGRATYIFPHNSPAPVWMEPILGQMVRQEGPSGPDGEPLFVVYRFDRFPAVNAAVQTDVTLGNAVRLAGYDVGSGVSGEQLPLTLYWQVTAVPPAEWIPYVHLEDRWRYRWGQVEQVGYPAAQWEVGEVIVQQIEVTLREGMPPGNYQLRVGLFDGVSQAQLALFDGGGRYAGSGLTIEDVFVLEARSRPEEVPSPPNEIGERVRPMLRLLGYEAGKRTLTNGEPLWVSLWWEATDAVPRTVTRLELLRPNNVGVILLDSHPAHGTYPFAAWPENRFVIDHYTPEIPLNLESGTYRLQVRMLGGDGETLGVYGLGEVVIEGTEKRFDVPEMGVEQRAVFGNQIELVGYTLAGLDLELVWRAVERPAADYTIFVHVLNEDGTCCLWQQDVMPQQGRYPTGLWVVDEVVVDRYGMVLPEDVAAGEYQIEVGVYIGGTGQRLAVEHSGEGGEDFVYLRPLVVE